MARRFWAILAFAGIVAILLVIRIVLVRERADLLVRERADLFLPSSAPQGHWGNPD